jgi:ABC-type nitrate/sulfonate/bicarbonate transport system substrate-binding protein
MPSSSGGLFVSGNDPAPPLFNAAFVGRTAAGCAAAAPAATPSRYAAMMRPEGDAAAARPTETAQLPPARPPTGAAPNPMLKVGRANTMTSIQIIRKFALLAGAALLVLLAACGTQGNSGERGAAGNTEKESAAQDGGSDGSGSRQERVPVTMVLDWTPNTNHTGLYVAKAKGYYDEQGLDVAIVLPGDAGADQMVATGNAHFGVSYQESITQARIAGVPIVSIAAVIQHNTSGFAAPADRNIKSPKDFEGKVYGGGWNYPVERAVIQSLMEIDGADVNKVQFLNTGDGDFFTSTSRGDVDFAWIYYAWTGVEAELRGIPIDMIYLNEYSEKLDYYTPVIATNERMIAENPELVRKFMAAVSAGYKFAIEHPEEAAEILLDAVPELDRDLVVASQQWLSPRYQDDAPRWGEQKESVWRNYADWLLEHGLLEKELDAAKAFTNEFLPE